MPTSPAQRTPRRPDTTPEELAQRAQRGSRAAYSDLVRVFEARLYNFLLRRTGSPSDAEDLAQEAFIRAWQRIGTYRSEWRFSTWLFTIASRLAASQRRRPTVRAGAVFDDQAAPPAPIRFRDDRASRARVWVIVEETLGPVQQTALWLRYVEGMAVRDIARVMGRTQVSVRVMLFRCRASLAESLREEPDVVEDITPAIRLNGRPAKRGVEC